MFNRIIDCIKNFFQRKVANKIMSDYDNTRYYAIYNLAGNLLCVSTSDMFMKFNPDGQPRLADNKDCECIYAGDYFVDSRWMHTNRNKNHKQRESLIYEISEQRFDKLFDELYGNIDPCLESVLENKTVLS